MGLVARCEVCAWNIEVQDFIFNVEYAVFTRWCSLQPLNDTQQGSPDCWNRTLIQPCDHTSQHRIVPDVEAFSQNTPLDCMKIPVQAKASSLSYKMFLLLFYLIIYLLG